MQNTAKIAALLLLLNGAVAAQTEEKEPATRLTLEQAVELALQRNLDVALARRDLETFRSQYRQAVAALIGDVRGVANYNRNVKKAAAFLTIADPSTGQVTQQKLTFAGDNSFGAGLHFEQPLFSGGRLSAGVVGGRRYMEAGEEAWRAAREEAVFATKQFFYSHLLARETAAIQADNLTLANDHLATIRERFKQGLDSDLIVLRQQVEVANGQATLIQAKNLEELSITNLQNILSLDVERPLQLVGVLDPPAEGLPLYEKVVAYTLEHNPSLGAARKTIEVYGQALKVARAKNWPDLNGIANLDWAAEADGFSPGPQQRNTSFTLGLKLDWPLFTGGDIREQIRQASIEVERTREKEQKIEQGIRVEVKQQWLSVLEAMERAKAQQAAVGQARRALEATEVRYRQGHASQLEQNDATFALNRARTVYAQASHDYWVARFALEKAMGALLKEIR